MSNFVSNVENDAKMLVFGQKGDVSAKILSKKDSHLTHLAIPSLIC